MNEEPLYYSVLIEGTLNGHDWSGYVFKSHIVAIEEVSNGDVVYLSNGDKILTDDKNNKPLLVAMGLDNA